MILSSEKENTTMTNIYVGNLSYQTSEDDLHAAFAVFGGIERVSIVTDRDTGQPRGFGFVEMAERESAEKAIAQLNGSDLGGRAITVNEARPKPTGGSGYGGGRSGGGGRGRGSRW
jgi:RNA recognition motif-containing protein